MYKGKNISPIKAELCIGSAQIGLNYGVSNKTGKISKNDLKEIFNLVIKRDISLIDTAKNYGNAEKIIGNYLSLESNIKIITKIDIENSLKFGKYDFDNLNNLVEDSLSKLNRKNIEGLLIHNPSILNQNISEEIFEWFNELKKRKRVNKVGVSIYHKEDISNIDLKHIDLIQLPLSIYDQRLINNGTIKALKSEGVDVHVRSIFLQGLLLEEVKNWPKFIPDNFKSHHKNFYSYLSEKKLTAIEATFIFLKSLKDIDAVVVGVSNKKELQMVCRCWRKIQSNQLLINNFKKWNFSDPEFLDPRNWTKYLP